MVSRVKLKKVVISLRRHLNLRESYLWLCFHISFRALTLNLSYFVIFIFYGLVNC